MIETLDWLIQQTWFSPLLSLLNIIFIFLTIVVSIFAWRTSIRANELQMLPFLSFYFRGGSMKDRVIRIRNIGKSPAFDIRIDPFIRLLTDIQKEERMELSLSGTNVLIPDEERELTVKTFYDKEPSDAGDFMKFILDPEEDFDRERIKLGITYRNVEGHFYYSKIETGKGGLYIKPAKKIGIWVGITIFFEKIKTKLQIGKYKIIWKFTKPHIKFPKKH